MQHACKASSRTQASQVAQEPHSTVAAVKQDLAANRSFLSFRPPLTAPNTLRRTTWQGILFRDSRAIGKLCSPSVSLTPVLEEPSASPADVPRTAFQQCSLAFDSWVPARSSSSSSSNAAAQPLRIPVDAGFEQAELSVQVIGRQDSTGASFALPQRYTVRGKDLAAQLQVELQRQSYVQRHQAARKAAEAAAATAQHPADSTAAAAGPVAGVTATPSRVRAATPKPGTVIIESGDEVERLLSVFEVAEKPTWLKSLVCKFLVAEAPAKASGPASSEPAHAASPCEAGTEGGSSSGSAPAAQRKQPGKRHKTAARAPQHQQQEQAAAEETAPESLAPCEGQPEVAQASSPLPRQVARKPKKKKVAKARAQVEHNEEEANVAAAMGEPLPEAAAAVLLAAPSPASQQMRGRSQQRRATREPGEPWSPSTAGKARRPPRRSSLGPPGVWAEPSALGPPPGLHLLPSHDGEHVQQRSSYSSELQLSPAGSQPADALPARLGRRAGGRGAHRGPAFGGSSSDISSELATSVRHASSIAALSSRCTSPSPSLDAANLPATPPVEMLGAAAAPARSHGFALDTPEAVRQLTEALLPHEASPSPARVVNGQQGRCAAAMTAEGEKENEGGEPEQGLAAEDSMPLPIPLSMHLPPLEKAAAAAAEPAAPARQQLNAAAPEFVSSAGTSPRLASLSEPSSPSSHGLPGGESQGYSSGMASSHASTQTLGSQSWSQGWLPSSDSSSGYSQHSHRHRLASKLYPGRTQSAPQSPQPWSPVSDGSSGSAWSQQPSRFGQVVAAGHVAADMQLPGALRGHGRVEGVAGLAPGSWQQQLEPQQAEQWRAYGNPAVVPLSVPRPALYGHGAGAAAPPNGTHPVLYQQRYQQQQQYLAVQAQHGMLAALGQSNQPGNAAAAVQDGQHNPCFDPGYQQQQVWQQQQQQHPAGAGSLHSNGTMFGRGHGRPQGEIGGERCGAAVHGRSQQQLDPRRHVGQWQYPSSAPASLAASPSVGPKLQGMHPQQHQRVATLEPLALQVVDSDEDSPDLERFLEAVTPLVATSSKKLEELALGDVWRFYEVPSMFGQEVATLGGPRGPAAAYYLPYLSAVQLFAPLKQQDGAAAECGRDGSSSWRGSNAHPRMQREAVFTYPGGLDEWPAEMRLAYQWFAAGHVGERIPLLLQLEQLCGAAGVGHQLMATRICDLHPCSWFAVAWYPLYRIPDAPLDARFLTYHSFASLWELAREAQQAAGAQQAQVDAPNGHAAVEGPCEGKVASGAAAQPALPATCPKTCVPLSPFAAAAAAVGACGGLGPQSTTPTCVSSFPCSPTCSEADTGTTHVSAHPAGSLGSGGSGSQHSVAELGHSSGGGSATPSPAASELGDVETPTGAAILGPAGGGCSASTGGKEEHADHAADGRGSGGSGVGPVKVPVVGLQWYTMARSTENWLDTLVAAQLPGDITPVVGTALADGSRICGCWRGVAVVAKPYPAAKGGPMAWEVTMQELEGTAQRLATGMGLHMRPPGSSNSVPAAVRCPDHDFFASRSWTRRAGMAGMRWGRHHG